MLINYGAINFNLIQATTAEIRINFLIKLKKLKMTNSILIPPDTLRCHSCDNLGFTTICEASDPSDHLSYMIRKSFISLFFY